MSEDPWECFGEDSSIEDDLNEDEDHAENRLRLISKANNSSSQKKDAGPTDVESTSTPENDNNEEDHLPQTLNLWKNRPPLYFGPMAVIETPNSNRGYIATKNLRPGTLLLVEEPLFKWPQEQIGCELGLSSIKAIFDNERAQEIVNEMEYLYPTRSDVDAICIIEKEKEVKLNDNQRVQIKDMMDAMKFQLDGEKLLERVVATAQQKGISKSQNGMNSILDDMDVFRMLLALRYNGFDSGLYLHFAMFNHSCDANCIKFMPENDLKGNNRKYSEVRTTKFVRVGEALTLHYLNPREVSHATRRKHIWEQHRFDIGEQMSLYRSELQEMDLVNGSLPISSRDNQDQENATSLVEKSLRDLQDLFRELNIASSSNPAGNEAAEMFEHCKALEMATEELIQASSNKLNNKRHLLLIRCCRLHLDSSEILLRLGTSGLREFCLTNKQQLEIMKKFVCTCHNLLSLQTQYLGCDHPDIARTNYDLAMGINGILSRSPKSLFELNLPGLTNFDGCQRFEGDCRKNHHRIDLLYPRDVEQKISQKR